MRGIAAILLSVGAVLVVMANASSGFADEATEARLREALRNATEQLQELQQEKAAWEVQKAQVPAAPPPPPRSAANTVSRATYEREVTRLNAQHTADAAEIAKLEAARQAAAGQIGDKDADATKAKTALAEAERHAKALEDKNAKLVALSQEILERYKNIDFGDVLGAKEPFVGAKRVEIENLAQDYGDKIEDNKAGP